MEDPDDEQEESGGDVSTSDSPPDTVEMDHPGTDEVDHPNADEVDYPAAVEPGDPDSVAEGDTFTYTRSFTEAEVEAFVELSRDENPRHVQPDEDDRLVVHGLLTGTLPTKIGGDLEYVARELNYTFHQPVYTGEAIRCEMTVTSVEEHDRGVRVRTTYECRNEDGTVVVTGDSDGVIFE